MKDWLEREKFLSETRAETEQEVEARNKYHGKRYHDYIDEQIREAQERGEFDNLPGMGKPLNIDENPYAGERALSYSLLKSNGFAPREVELGKEIRGELQRAKARLASVQHRGRTLRSRRVPPFPSEKRAFNAALRHAIAEYESTLRELNRKILTLNLMAPSSMHMAPLNVDQLLQDFRASCPPFEL